MSQTNSLKTTNTLSRKSVTVRQSRLSQEHDVEIAAQIIIPPDGGWGWVVVTASFFVMFIMDGNALSFGALMPDIALDINKPDSLVALINSIAFGVYFFAAPVASGFINRFGFRVTAMIGSVLCSVSMITTYFLHNYVLICLFQGFLTGCGYSFLNMSCTLIVGFYFEKRRAIAIGVAVTGSSIGVMIMAPINSYLVELAGWRTTILLHSSLFGMIYFISMAYRPLVSVTLLKTTGAELGKSVYSISKASVIGVSKKRSTKVDALGKVEDDTSPTATERLFQANANFPTAAEVVKELESSSDLAVGTSGQPSTSKEPTVPAELKEKGLSQRKMQQIKSVMSRVGGMDLRTSVDIEHPVSRKEKTSGCCGRLCHWDKHVDESRPLYKDDAFYAGKVEKLPEYRKSMIETSPQSRTGLEYQLAVSRAAAVTDLSERRGVFTTAFRRVMASMMDPGLMRRGSYILLCISAIFVFIGYTIPFIFIQDRNFSAGVSEQYASWYVSSIGFACIFGRLILLSFTSWIRPMYLLITSVITAGLATCFSDLSYDVYYQFGYCIVYGFTIAGVTTLRSLSLVELYGLNRLTNATGMIVLFQGIGSVIGAPVVGGIKAMYGYRASFIFAGVCEIFGAILLIPVHPLANKEEKKLNRPP